VNKKILKKKLENLDDVTKTLERDNKIKEKIGEK
jgi:hypothetical protein